MARVHLFTSHHSGDQKHQQIDKAYASLSVQEQSTIAHTHKEAPDEPHTLDVTAVASPNITDDQDDKSSQKENIEMPAGDAGLTTTLLHNPPHMDVVGSLASALSAKQGKQLL